MSTTYVTINGKNYGVRSRRDGTLDVFVYWDGFDISQRDFARQTPIHRMRYIDPNGRIGRRVVDAAMAVAPTKS